MKLILTTNDGEVLDDVRIDTSDWKRIEKYDVEAAWAAHAVLNCLVPGTEALKAERETEQLEKEDDENLRPER